ncbi:hypothetical protein FB451DRAFT_1368716 [Mycena latifolia]|nr:hypothetical protein FB451DRAFT_1368716 [Mycena latifolia]
MADLDSSVIKKRTHSSLRRSDRPTVAWLLSAEAELARIDNEIRLEARRNALLAPVQVYRAALAPHKVLPDDALREIFLWAALTPSPKADLDEIVESLMGNTSSHLDVRLIIGRVCSHWRLVALGMPELWNNVGIQGRFSLLKVVDLWLARSGLHPISLDIRSAHDAGARALLMRYSHRIRFLSLDSLEPLGALDGSMDLLEKLVVRGVPDREASIPIASVCVLRRAPRLRSITLHRIFQGARLNLRSLGIPLRQLTEFRLDNINIDVLQSYGILEECTALTCARLALFYEPEVPTIGRKIALPELRKLDFRGRSLSKCAKFLGAFILPSLRELVLSYFSSLDPDDASGMYDVPTFQALRHLTIYTNDWEEHGEWTPLTPWLAACPSAVGVWLPDHVMRNPVLLQISEGSLLPNVEILIMAAVQTSPLLAALQARQRSHHHSTITEAGVMRLPQLLTHEREALAELMEQGVFVGRYRRFEDEPARGEIEKSARRAGENGTFINDSQRWRPRLNVPTPAPKARRVVDTSGLEK